jgi:hypothetical protein
MMIGQSGGKMTENGEVRSHFCRVWSHRDRPSSSWRAQSQIESPFPDRLRRGTFVYGEEKV